MALLVTTHSVIINLPAVYLTFEWDAATCKDNIENYSLSKLTSKSKKYRAEEVYSKGETHSDGFLLVYHFSEYNEKKRFLNFLVDDLGFNKHEHVADANSLWCETLTLSGEKDFKPEVVDFVKHVQDERIVICLSESERQYFEGIDVLELSLKWTIISREYVDYENRNLFLKVFSSLHSLVKTKFKHVNYFMPYKFEQVTAKVRRYSVSNKCLPGIVEIVPSGERDLAAPFEFEPSYLFEE